MKEISILQQEKVINKAYISPSELQELVPIGINNARAIMKEIITKMQKNNQPVFNYKQLYAPTQIVLKHIGLDEQYIREQAELIRKGKSDGNI